MLEQHCAEQKNHQSFEVAKCDGNTNGLGCALPNGRKSFPSLVDR